MLIQNRRARLFLLVCFLTTSLVFPALSSRAHADPPPSTTSPAPATQQDPPLSDDELHALHLAFRGFVAVTLPGGIHNGCEGHEASGFIRRYHEFYRSWYTIKIEALCMGRAAQTAEVWFQCSDRGTVTCTLSQPYEAPPKTNPETNPEANQAPVTPQN